MQVDDYFKDVIEEIRRLQIVVSENIIFDKRSKYTGRITGFFVFIDESVMHFSEFVVIEDILAKPDKTLLSVSLAESRRKSHQEV